MPKLVSYMVSSGLVKKGGSQLLGGVDPLCHLPYLLDRGLVFGEFRVVFGARCFRARGGVGGSGAVGRRGIDWCEFLKSGVVRSSVVDVVWKVVDDVDEVLSVESEEEDRNEGKGDIVGL